MQTINLTAGAASDALVLLSQHLPPTGIEIGRPILARLSADACEHDPDPEVDVLTDLALWTVTRAGVDRLIEFDDREGLVELTTFVHGRETFRALGSYDRL